jgi:hypothetical protein
MAKTPGPKPTGDGCVTIGGYTVCPHVVHLSSDQLKIVKKMHQHNVDLMDELAKAEKASKKKKKKTKKKSS